MCAMLLQYSVGYLLCSKPFYAEILKVPSARKLFGAVMQLLMHNELMLFEEKMIYPQNVCVLMNPNFQICNVIIDIAHQTWQNDD